MEIKDKVLNWYEHYCYMNQIDSDLFDINSEIDSTLNFYENINIIEEKLNNLMSNGVILDKQHIKAKELEEKEKNHALKENVKLDVRRILKNNLTILMARTNEAKTAFMCKLIEDYKKQYSGNIFAFGLAPELIEKLEINEFNSLLEMEEIENSIIIVDELRTLLDLENRKRFNQIDNILRRVEHKGNKLFLSGLPSDFKKFLCAKARCFLFKSLEISDLINGSRAKAILLQYRGSEMGTYGLYLPKGEVLCYDSSFWKEKFEYNKAYDTKKDNLDLFKKKEKAKCAENV